MTKQTPAQELARSVRLSNDLQMIVTADLRVSGTPTDPVYHFVYASQLYSTLFAVYSRFNITPLGDRCRVDSIDLDLFNYNGAVNIGFIDEDPLYKVDGQNKYVLFGVRGMSTKRSARVSLAVPGQPEVIVERNIPTRLTFSRYLYQMFGFYNTPADIIDTVTGELDLKVPDLDHFDTEFYSRSGSDYYRDPLRNGQTETRLKDIAPARVASPRCTQSDVNLIY